MGEELKELERMEAEARARTEKAKRNVLINRAAIWFLIALVIGFGLWLSPEIRWPYIAGLAVSLILCAFFLARAFMKPNW